MSTIDVSAAVKATKLIQETIAKLEARRVDLVSERDSLVDRNARLLDMPLRRDEAKELILKTIDIMAADFMRLAKWGEVFKAFAQPAGYRSPGFNRAQGGSPIKHGGPLSLADVQSMLRPGGGSNTINGVLSLGGADFFRGAADDSPIVDSCRAAFFFGDAIKAKIELHFEALFPQGKVSNSDSESALSIADRQNQINANDDRLAAVEEEMAAVARQLDQLSNSQKDLR